MTITEALTTQAAQCQSLQTELASARKLLDDWQQQLQAREHALDAKWQNKWDSLWEALQEEAERRDWCDQYDDFAEAHGGPRRDHDYTVTVDVTVRIIRSVSAHHADDAGNEALELIDIREGHEYTLHGENASVYTVEVVDVEEG